MTRIRSARMHRKFEESRRLGFYVASRAFGAGCARVCECNPGCIVTGLSSTPSPPVPLSLASPLHLPAFLAIRQKMFTNPWGRAAFRCKLARPGSCFNHPLEIRSSSPVSSSYIYGYTRESIYEVEDITRPMYLSLSNTRSARPVSLEGGLPLVPIRCWLWMQKAAGDGLNSEPSSS